MKNIHPGMFALLPDKRGGKKSFVNSAEVFVFFLVPKKLQRLILKQRSSTQ